VPEVAAGRRRADLIAVRDTRQDGTGPVLMFSPATWRDFAGQIKAVARRCRFPVSLIPARYGLASPAW
jgi:hypothetical protein